MAEPFLPPVWAIIPARGGSKGIPGKNLKKIQGRSLIARAVSAARSAHCIARVFVSTDDAAIAVEARRAGAEVINRPALLSGDTASSEDALLHALDTLEHNGETLPGLFVFVQCTSPFVCGADIDGTVAALRAASADTAHTVVASHGFLWRHDGDGGATGVNHDKRVRPRRQEREAEFLETGAAYAMRTTGFRTARHRFFGKTALYEMPAMRTIEIDVPEDLATARLLAPLIEPEILAPLVPDPLGGLVLDFDGVLTDDTVILDENGVEAVVCSRSDGMGIGLLKERNIPVAVISKERNPVVAMRCRKLGIECISACDDKLAALQVLCEKWGVTLSQMVYTGNDLPDIACIEAVGLGVAVADAHPFVRAAADLVLTKNGGQGAVREVCDLILRISNPMADPRTLVDL